MANQADDARLHAFFQSVRREFGVEAGAEPEMDTIESAYDGRHGILVLLERNGEVVATFAAVVHRYAVVEFRHIYLAPAERGNGLGSTLFHCFMGLCLRLGYPSVVLETHPNFKVANAFFRSAGFRPARVDVARRHSDTEWLRFHFSDPV